MFSTYLQFSYLIPNKNVFFRRREYFASTKSGIDLPKLVNRSGQHSKVGKHRFHQKEKVHSH